MRLAIAVTASCLAISLPAWLIDSCTALHTYKICVRWLTNIALQHPAAAHRAVQAELLRQVTSPRGCTHSACSRRLPAIPRQEIHFVSAAHCSSSRTCGPGEGSCGEWLCGRALALMGTIMPCTERKFTLLQATPST